MEESFQKKVICTVPSCPDYQQECWVHSPYNATMLCSHNKRVCDIEWCTHYQPKAQ